MRHRKPAGREQESAPPPAVATEGSRHATLQNGMGGGPDANISLLKVRCAKDFFARLCFVGIFLTENMLHAANFEAEVDSLVGPALRPLPREAAVSLHLVHIIFGVFGAIFVIISGFDTAGRTALTKGTSMMMVFMCTITWTWWINRQGVPYWDLDPYYFWDARSSAEKRLRTVHILKNISIFGAMTIFQQMAKYDVQARPDTRPSPMEGLVTALRPWSFTATLAPLVVTLATLRCHLNLALPGYAAPAVLLLAIMGVQAMSNLLNSYVDFCRGVDTVETAGDRTLVDNLVSARTLKCLAAAFFVCSSVYFVWSFVATGFNRVVVSMAVLGTCIAICYTPLKYLGLGDVVVFVCFGPALIAYACAVLVDDVPWQALALSAPVTPFVVATLHANNYRDIEADSKCGVRTVAILLGPQLSLHYYSLLLACAHIGVLLAGLRCSCAGVLATLFVLPQTVWLRMRINRKELLRSQDEETAKTTMMFGLTLALGVITMPGPAWTPAGLGVAALLVCVLKMLSD